MTTKAPQSRYVEARGGRKTAHARARIHESSKGIVVNDKEYKEYFKSPRDQQAVAAPFKLLQLADTVKATVRVAGGGIRAQAVAVQNAIAKAIVKTDVEAKKRLRKAGFITRDARKVERKKYGLKKARRAPQWSKR
ncbi:MAG: 30S ribosomal protein S9 [Patescibacteria group bacterium]